MDNFSYEIKRDLIKLVYERRDLWDPTSPNVRNNNKREKIWEEIGKQLRIYYGDCKEEWVKLRKSYKRYKQTDDSNSSSPNYKYFHLMSFLDVIEQQGNANQQQRNVQQININVNQQQRNVNQQKRKENQQQRNETQHTNNVNQPNGIENYHHSGNNSGTQNLRPEAGGQQYDQRAAQSVHVNVNVEGIPQPFCKNNPAARPKPKPKVARKQMPQGKRIINKNNNKKETCARPRPKLISSKTLVADDLNSFCRQVRSTFGILPRDLQIKAQDELFQVLSKFKKEALADKRAREDQQVMLLALPLRHFDRI